MCLIKKLIGYYKLSSYKDDQQGILRRLIWRRRKITPLSYTTSYNDSADETDTTDETTFDSGIIPKTKPIPSIFCAI